jgi:hypothetical protein
MAAALATASFTAITTTTTQTRGAPTHVPAPAYAPVHCEMDLQAPPTVTLFLACGGVA